MGEDKLISERTGEGFIRQASPSERHQTLLFLLPLYYPLYSSFQSFL